MRFSNINPGLVLAATTALWTQLASGAPVFFFTLFPMSSIEARDQVRKIGAPFLGNFCTAET